MYSAVFAVNPAAAADLIRRAGEIPPCRDSEVMDIDEEAYRSGRLSARLYGYACVPFIPERTQGGKQVFEQQDEERAKDDIAVFINEVMLPETLYIIGAGSTTARIIERLGLAPPTLLGSMPSGTERSLPGTPMNRRCSPSSTTIPARRSS